MRILVFSTLFPNAAMPLHGVFVENRLAAFRKKYDADVKVVAPVPWFPFQNGTFGRYARWARVPKMEIRSGVEVFHPRYVIPPGLGMRFAPSALARCLRKTIALLEKGGWDFHFIDAHYFYPDGVAAVAVAKEIRKPIAITARGSDVNWLPAYAEPRKMIVKAAMQADAVITVAAALKGELVKLGAPAQKISVLRNGVDLDRFAPVDRDAVRKKLQLTGPVLLSVGHLIDRKGHDRVINALHDIPEATLLITGDGEKRDALAALAKACGLDRNVRFLGALPHAELRDLYSAADVLVLASSREGWANVLLEAMACGTPCVATNVWGSGEVIRDPAAGRLVDGRTPKAIAAAVNALLAAPPDRDATRRYAERHSWDETANGMAAIFSTLAAAADAGRNVQISPLEALLENGAPKLIVTMDAEEQFDWRDFENREHRINDAADLDRFQKICADANVTPLYFLTYPMLANARTAAYFRNLRHTGAADCGLHLHPWATPPTSDFLSEYYSFQKNLPPALHRAKLKALADAFEHVFDARAVSHRAGRYGIALENYPLLAEIGVRYDFSPSAGFDFSNLGGPDFSDGSNRPFMASGEDWRVFATPVCGGAAIQKTRAFLSQENLSSGFARSFRSRFSGWMRPMRLSPEGARFEDLKALTRRLAADKTPVLTFTLHSTSLTPGANAYAKDKAAVDRRLDLIRRYLDWFREKIGGDIISFDELAALYENNARNERP